MRKIALALLVIALVLTGCSKTAKTETAAPAAAADTVTVSWYDGSKLLKEEQVAKGSKLTSWAPEKADATFMAWYSEASKTILFDFNAPVNADTDLFAGFKGAFTEDTTTWCLIGSGAGTLKGSQWNESADVEEQFKLTKVDTPNTNIFKIENVTLYEGDAFQVRVMGTWTGQHGVGYLEGYTPLATADGDIVGEVLVNGERWFYANGGFGESPNGWNVNVAKSGVYTIILETNPGSNDYDVMKLERTGDAQKIEITHDMYVVGTVFDWAPTDEGQMETDAVRETFTFTLNVTEDKYADWTDGNAVYGTTCAAVKVLNGINGSWYGVSGQEAGQTSWTLTTGGADNLLLKAGQYNVTYDTATDSATVSLSEKGYFLAGVVDGADHWDCTAVNHQFEKVSDTEYVVYYTFTEADTASWIRDGGHKGAVKATYGFSGNSADLWFGREGDQENMMVDEYGLYEIKLHLTGEGAGYITAEKLEGLFLVGTIGDGDTWRAESAYKITDGSSVTYTWKAQDPASWLGSDIAAVKIISVDAAGNVTWYGTASGDNVIISAVGTYTLTLKDGVVTATKK
ncbi:MAG: hypothetical protein J5785_06595 [Spirochaetales bacterium]|nr:hypothetical protein [Spirochaetales bacterium]